METKQIGYAEAVAEIEAIIAKMNNNQLDIEQLTADVERATMLITLCQERLLKTQEQIEKILSQPVN